MSYDARQVDGGDMKLFGIEPYVMMRDEVLGQQAHKGDELFRGALADLSGADVLGHDIHQVKYKLEAKRVIDLDNPVPTVLAEVDFSKAEATGKYVCSVCGYVYDPAEHDGVAFEDLPDDWRCPRCKQPKEKFNKA